MNGGNLSKVNPSERPRKYKTEQYQVSSDEEIFDKAKINSKRLDRLTQKKIVDALVTFGEAISEIKLYKYERDLAERIFWSLILNDGAVITSLFCRQSGKSTTVGSNVLPSASILLPLLAEHLKAFEIKSHLSKYEKGFWAGTFAPDYERASIIGSKANQALTTKQAKLILSEPDIGMEFPERLTSYLGELPRNSYINVKSANRRVSIEGDTFHIVVTDETQEIDDLTLKKSISPMLAATNGTMVHLGSTYYKRVYFYDICKLNKSNDTKRTKRKKQHFEINYKVAQKYNKNYKKYIQKEKDTLGEYSDEFRMSYELFWPLEKGMFITEDVLTSRLGKQYYVTNYDKTNDHVIGIDVAKTVDSTVVTILEVDWDNPILVDPESGITRYPKKVKNWLEIHGDDYDAQFTLICDFIDNYKWNILVCDATGVGSHMSDRLENKYKYKGKTIVPFVYTRPDKSYAYSLLYKEILSERIIFPNSDEAKRLRKQRRFVLQMSNLSKHVQGGYLVVEALEDNDHDDYPDSLMLAVYGVDEEVEQEVEDHIDYIYKTGANERMNFYRNRHVR